MAAAQAALAPDHDAAPVARVIDGRWNLDKANRNGARKLEIAQVRDIRASAAASPLVPLYRLAKQLGAEYGVSRRAIEQIVRGETWFEAEAQPIPLTPRTLLRTLGKVSDATQRMFQLQAEVHAVHGEGAWVGCPHPLCVEAAKVLAC